MVLLCVCVCDLTAFDGSATSGKSIHTYTLWDWLMKSSRVILIKQAGNLQAEITEMWWFTYIHTCRLNIYIHQPATASKRTNRWNTYIDILVKISLAYTVAESLNILTRQCAYFIHYLRSFQRWRVTSEAPDLHKAATFPHYANRQRATRRSVCTAFYIEDT